MLGGGGNLLGTGTHNAPNLLGTEATLRQTMMTIMIIIMIIIIIPITTTFISLQAQTMIIMMIIIIIPITTTSISLQVVKVR